MSVIRLQKRSGARRALIGACKLFLSSCIVLIHIIYINRKGKMFSTWKLFCGKISQRWIFAVMGSFAISVVYAMRTCLSVAITEMVISTESSTSETSDDEVCAASNSTSSSSSSSGKFEWDEYTQGIILSSFYWGYVITQVPCGLLVRKIGGKYTLALGILSSSTFNLLTPIIVNTWSSTGLIVVRVLIGLGEGAIFPSVNFLVAQWAPPTERSTIGTVVMAGTQIGTILGTGLTGVIIEYSEAGWPTVFYFFGAVGIVWLILWMLICYENPEVHPFIGGKEKKFMQDSMQGIEPNRSESTPWKQILTSTSVWALLLAKLGHDWGFFTMVTDLPKYMSNVLHFSIQSNGLVSAFPYVVMWVASVVSSWIADWLIKRGTMSRTNVRKLMTTIAAVFPAIFIMAASYAGCDRIMVVAMFSLLMGFMGPFYPGIMVNAIDLSPNHGSILMAMMTCIGGLAGIAGPYLVGILTPNQLLTEWRLVFWISCGIFLASNVIYLIWGDGEIQFWNDSKSRTKDDKKLESVVVPNHLSIPQKT